MVRITKQEKEAIQKRFPRVGFVRTMRQDSHRHCYYMEENRGAMALLKKLRNDNVVYDSRKVGLNGNRKTSNRNRV